MSSEDLIYIDPPTEKELQFVLDHCDSRFQKLFFCFQDFDWEETLSRNIYTTEYTGRFYFVRSVDDLINYVPLDDPSPFPAATYHFEFGGSKEPKPPALATAANSELAIVASYMFGKWDTYYNNFNNTLSKTSPFRIGDHPTRIRTQVRNPTPKRQAKRPGLPVEVHNSTPIDPDAIWNAHKSHKF